MRKMKRRKIVITKDYTDTMPDEVEFTDKDREMAKEAIDLVEAAKKLPHMIDLAASSRFDKAVRACDAIAKEFSGQMSAVVDFETYTASIRLECAYIEFCPDEFMKTLTALSLIAKRIQMESTLSNLLRIDILMPYFVTLS